MKNTAGLVVLIIAAITVGPLLNIWALNTLFPGLAIPYTMSTWAASILLAGSLKMAQK